MTSILRFTEDHKKHAFKYLLFFILSIRYVFKCTSTVTAYHPLLILLIDRYLFIFFISNIYIYKLMIYW